MMDTVGSYLIADASYLLHRSIHLELNTSKGEFVGGVYGVIRYVRTLVDRFKPQKAIFIWDGGKSKRRKAMYPEYKASRELDKSPEAEQRRSRYYFQREILQEILPSFGIRSHFLWHREADDVIDKMARIYKHKFPSIVIATEDWDYAQAIDNNVLVYFPIKCWELTLSNFEKLAGYPFGWHNLYRGVIGDGSDEINGIKGLGDVTLLKWIKKSEENGWPPSLASLVEVCTQENSAKAKAFLQNIDTVVRNVNLMDMSLEEFTDTELKDLDVRTNAPCVFTEECVQYLAKYEFKSFLQDFGSWSRPFRILR